MAVSINTPMFLLGVVETNPRTTPSFLTPFKAIFCHFEDVYFQKTTAVFRPTEFLVNFLVIPPSVFSET